MHNFHPSIIREYDIRGIYGETLSDADAFFLGKKYVAFCSKKPPKIVVGYDGRLSSPALAAELCRGLAESGADVVNVGLVPTPALYFSVFEFEADGGIMVTGSHNPANHNGFKMMRGKDSLFGDEIRALSAVANFVDGTGSAEVIDIKEKYINRLKSEILNFKFSIAWDCGNGATGEIMQLLTKQMAGEQHLLFAEIDGNFPNHHPDPTKPENLQDLRATVLQNGCDIGFAFDGDGDRVGILDNLGRIIWGDQILAILAAEVLAANKGAKIVADIKSSQLFIDEVLRLGGEPILWKTGHSHIKSHMKKLGAPLAGEMSAHIFFADRYFGFDDGIYAALRFLGVMATTGKTAAELLDSLPKYHSSPEFRLPCPDDKKFAIVAEILAEATASGAEINSIDGLRVTEPDGWWLVRASNTGAEIVARCEGKTPEALQRLLLKLEQVLASHNLKL